MTRQAIVLESCSNPQKTANFRVCNEQILFLGFGFFVSDIISGILLDQWFPTFFISQSHLNI